MKVKVNEMAKIIVIDAGHGYNTSGKRCLKSIDPNETREWFLNDRIADIVESQLTANHDCKVLRVDDTTGAKDISLPARVKTANNANADIYISIHHNAGIYGASGGGTVVYHYNGNFDGLRAKKLYDKIIAKTGLIGNRSEKTSVGDFYVINKTRMPALLIENGFMDSLFDTPIILTEEHAKKTAEGIIDFVVEYFHLENKATESPEVSKYYPACDKRYVTISTGLASIGVNSSYSFRCKIAKANNIAGYIGTATQNTRMLNLLKAGLLIQP